MDLESDDYIANELGEYPVEALCRHSTSMNNNEFISPLVKKTLPTAKYSDFDFDCTAKYDYQAFYMAWVADKRLPSHYSESSRTQTSGLGSIIVNIPIVSSSNGSNIREANNALIRNYSDVLRDIFEA